MKKTLIASASFFALPLIASAAYLDNIVQLLGVIRSIVNSLIPIAIAITVVAFFYGLFTYVKSAGKDHKKGRNIMIAGIIALFIEVSLWGVIGFFQGALLSGQSADIRVPQI